MFAQNLQSAFFFKFGTGFFSYFTFTCLVNMSKFVPVLACFVIFTCHYFDLRWETQPDATPPQI